MTWEKTIGRVSFINCEPLFHGLEESWNVLPAPPSWLTGHLMRRDCILAPIPAADYAKNSDKLVLVPDLSISSKGEVRQRFTLWNEGYCNYEVHSTAFGFCNFSYFAKVSD